jgi:pyrophosphatase PpaX
MTPAQTVMEILNEARARVHESGTVSQAETDREVSNVLDRFDVAPLSNARLRKGVRAVLDSLVSKGFRLGLVTSAGRKGVDSALNRLRLVEYFSVVVTRNDVQSMKPSGEGILKAIRMLGCDSADVAFVGDSWVDVRAAKDAGVRAMALVGGLSPLARLKEEHPDALVKSLHELLSICT